MQDQPTAQQLVEAVAQFLNAEVAPTLSDPRLRFRTLVAVNVLNVVARELEIGAEQVRGEEARLRVLVGAGVESGELPLTPVPSPTGRGKEEERTATSEEMRGKVEAMTRELCGRIRAGEADEGAYREAVLAHVEQTVVEKLRIANPRYLARHGE